MLWENVITGIFLMLTGMGVVFVSLFILMEFINVIGWAERLVGRIFRKKPAPASALAQEEITPEEVAVIIAATAEALAAKVEVYQIRHVHGEDQEAWSRMGRMDLMRSHNF